MKKLVAKKWVEALRSGEYEQNFGALRSLDGTKFCVLGVLCNILNPYGWDGDENGGSRLVSQTVAVMAGLKTKDLAGITCCLPEIPGRGALTYLNDYEGLTFHQLADLIERHYAEM